MWVVTLRKAGSTWYWFTENPQGGGFGSNQVSSLAAVRRVAMRNIPVGDRVRVVVNGKVSDEAVLVAPAVTP